MKMRLEPTACKYSVTVGEESGHMIEVIVTHDDEWGWGGSVILRSFGCKTPEDAAMALVPAAETFLAQMK